MAEELNLDGLKEMKKADYIKAFKNKAVWKKLQKHHLLLSRYCRFQMYV
jgi:hypothetical protein